ncbi:hypothetical protein [Pseudomonas sp. 2FE]|uniref:hypothetical protein n=1 Tax=Pseudomonas sp. 2FE TaxID=2502190 RepID=UPI0010FA5C7B|nr:hypothetical protein [Pseudomonas sp. 2FE]
MSAQQQFNGQLTLREINQLLTKHSFPPISREQLPAVLGAGDREKILRAVSQLENAKASEYLRGVMVQAGITFPQQGDPAQDEHYGAQPADDEQPMPNNDDAMIRQGGNPGAGQDEREKFHVYGGKAALCFEVDSTRGGVPTVALDAASSTSPKKYDWGSKIRIQMTRAELPVVAAVLMGSRQRCEFKNHGPDSSKGFSMERQAGGKVFVKVFAKGVPIKAVPVDPADVFFVASLYVLQIHKACPWLDTAGTIALVQATMQLDGELGKQHGS